jgi:hypothetical protein
MSTIIQPDTVITSEPVWDEWFGQPNDEKRLSVAETVLLGVLNRFKRDIAEFAASTCRCICTPDGTVQRINKVLIAQYGYTDTTEQEVDDALFGDNDARREKDDQLFRELGQGTDFAEKNGIVVVGDALIVYKRKNLCLYFTAMRDSNLWEFSALKMLALVATWDKTRPLVEELLIMGLFGDFQPCQSKEYSRSLKIGSFAEWARTIDAKMLSRFRVAHDAFANML